MSVFAIAMLLALCACDGHGKGGVCVYNGTTHVPGEPFPAVDGCNTCFCRGTEAFCTLGGCIDGGIDANPLSCVRSGGCPEGPACGAFCCKQGERCVEGMCQCGTKPACGSEDHCEAVGPLGGDACGVVCCGLSGPCPQ